jgi:hypothetical protein
MVGHGEVGEVQERKILGEWTWRIRHGNIDETNPRSTENVWFDTRTFWGSR